MKEERSKHLITPLVSSPARGFYYQLFSDSPHAFYLQPDVSQAPARQPRAYAASRRVCPTSPQVNHRPPARPAGSARSPPTALPGVDESGARCIPASSSSPCSEDLSMRGAGVGVSPEVPPPRGNHHLLPLGPHSSLSSTLMGEPSFKSPSEV